MRVRVTTPKSSHQCNLTRTRLSQILKSLNNEILLQFNETANKRTKTVKKRFQVSSEASFYKVVKSIKKKSAFSTTCLTL